MSESITDLRAYPDKTMGETATAASNPTLEVSVSFGRFENDSLSWERFSAFSPNKYLEEVEKCATPGSVAQKKAYFEAHYKKIAARKAELLELERQAQSDSNGGDRSFDSSSHGEDNGTEAGEVEQVLNGLSDEIGDTVIRDCSRIEEEEHEEIDKSAVSDVVLRESEENVGVNDSDEIGDTVIRDCSRIEEEEEHEEVDKSAVSDVVLRESEENVGANEAEVLSIESKPEKFEALESVESELKCSREIIDIDAMEVKVLDIETKPEKIESPKLAESILERDSEIKEVVVKDTEVISIELKPEGTEAPKILKTELRSDPTINDVKSKLGDRGISRKVTTVNKEKTVAKTKTKPLSPNPISRTPKSSSIPRLPNSSATRQSVSAKSTNLVNKKGNMNYTPSLLKNKSSSAGEAKKAVSKSLNMSLSYGSVDSDSRSQVLNRKSLFMEKMGDKDIVKRAFKAFQNSFNPVRSYGNESPLQKQVPVKNTETKISSSVTPRKVNGLHKIDRPEKRNVKTPTRSFDSRSEKLEKRTEVTKKLEQKLPSAIETEKAHSRLNSKETKDAERIKRSPGLRFKATPMPAFYREQKLPRSALDKMPMK